ncbi:MAG: invasion associated locus B family protein [Pseudomonadota bacterium]
MSRVPSSFKSALASSLFAAAVLAPGFAAAAPQAIATYRDWSVFVRDVNGDKVCFAATEAKEKSPKSVRHGNIFFLVSSWASGAAKHQPSLMTGYNMKDKPTPTVRVGSDKWSMYVSDNEAFIESNGDERKLINAMRRGADMRVSAVSSRGTATNYTISLRGVTKALERAETACR